MNGGYHSGGPGYVMSNAAFTSLCNHLEKNIKFCPNTGIDDVDVNACMRKLGVVMGKSTDNLGRQKFLAFSLKDTFYGW